MQSSSLRLRLIIHLLKLTKSATKNSSTVSVTRKPQKLPLTIPSCLTPRKSNFGQIKQSKLLNWIFLFSRQQITSHNEVKSSTVNNAQTAISRPKASNPSSLFFVFFSCVRSKVFLLPQNTSETRKLLSPLKSPKQTNTKANSSVAKTPRFEC